MTSENDDKRKAAEADAQIDFICELLHLHDVAEEDRKVDALRAILETPLTVSVRSNWQAPGTPLVPAEYEVLLSWGGPATRIIGELRDGVPVSVRLEHQDWFTAWRDHAVLYEYHQRRLMEFVRLLVLPS